MKIESNDGDFKIECSRDELSILSNALNNIPQAVSLHDYGSLIGAQKDQVDKMLGQLVSVLQ